MRSSWCVCRPSSFTKKGQRRGRTDPPKPSLTTLSAVPKLVGQLEFIRSLFHIFYAIFCAVLCCDAVPEGLKNSGSRLLQHAYDPLSVRHHPNTTPSSLTFRECRDRTVTAGARQSVRKTYEKRFGLLKRIHAIARYGDSPTTLFDW